MTPPWMDSNVHGSVPELWYQGDIHVDEAQASHGQQQQNNNHEPAQRHDSLIEGRRSIPRILELNSEHHHTFSEVRCPSTNGQDAQHYPTNMETMPRQRQPTITSTPSGPNTDDEDSNLLVVFENPTAPRDRSRMRDIRQHVMYDFLRKERRKVSGPRDARVENLPLTGAKRKRTEVGLVNTTGSGSKRDVSLNPSHPGNMFGLKSELTPASSIRSTASSLCEWESETSLAASNESPTSDLQQWHQRGRSTSASAQAQAHAPTPHRPSASPPRSQNAITQAPYEQSLMLPWRVKLEHTNYLAADPDTVPFVFPFPPTDLGTRINPFDTWPRFDDPDVDVRSLKHHCGVYFGSRGLLDIWVPVLLRARHTFLSTICIATAHKRAMRGIHGGAGQLKEKLEHLRAYDEVLMMINRAVMKEKSEQGVVSDETIVAELQLLMGEVMSGSLRTVCLHESSLTGMVCARGGLENTREDGLREYLPAILTVTLYVIAVSHEKLPHETFIRFADKQAQPPKTGERKPFPESPVFCGEHYVAVRRAVSENGQALQLLDLLRDMTSVFNSKPSRSRSDNLARYKKHIDAFKGNAKNRTATEEARRFEVIRLTARLYAHALANGVPFSQASSASGVRHEHIVRALSRTSLTDCWGPMAGVLFWIALVAGAAANDSSSGVNAVDYSSLVRTSPFEASGSERARKYLSTIAIRCSIVLGFEHGHVVLATLKRIVGMQQILAGSVHATQQPPSGTPESRPSGPANDSQAAVQARPPQQGLRSARPSVSRHSSNDGHLEAPTSQQPRFYGPPRPVYHQLQQQQRGFGDFSRDFPM